MQWPFWIAINISVNRRPLGVDEFVWSMDLTDLSSKKIRRCPVASASGQGMELEVWHGDFRCLSREFANLSGSLCVFDPFEMEGRRWMEKIMFNWKNETRAARFLFREPVARVCAMRCAHAGSCERDDKVSTTSFFISNEQ